jgi:hypothetical protein
VRGKRGRKDEENRLRKWSRGEREKEYKKESKTWISNVSTTTNRYKGGDRIIILREHKNEFVSHPDHHSGQVSAGWEGVDLCGGRVRVREVGRKER